MRHEVMFAGFGGQGIMLIGQMLAYAGMNEGKQAVWLPSYGPEMRGGTAYCIVQVSDDPIGSPVVANPMNAAVMNRPSLDKFGPEVKPGGLLLINSSLIPDTSKRTDISILNVGCNQIANEEGTGKAANMVILGALIGATKMVKPKSIEDMIEYQFGKKGKRKLVDINIRIFNRGLDIGKTSVKDRK
ncbi:MAG: 2-oxoacid:acceptor oxidoreductase family protein [Deltaproteobacteria bacterium]|nr:2-oxoacid:acceptor oxidoreductase family protein [Deltaproteobacteria bacterium]